MIIIIIHAKLSFKAVGRGVALSPHGGEHVIFSLQHAFKINITWTGACFSPHAQSSRACAAQENTGVVRSCALSEFCSMIIKYW